ncbi:RusA family crossover junction endodeoxyribonuclease [Acidithiobacillus caldus]|jgi:crossover junction endodeoxyribonuclease RusA|uniref:Uncharacterized protein n=1 Tax=Acidithiobacillus caldus TaxID=33059 RepID=A0A1E7YLT2_9PROT|nr:RusA family crossover junction endodeoxyribonuclease [Acidithiobacillus caldus]AUW32596.1 RusA family crossover junction endodeoxyribonuclease [Acidithiobacillus caldus]MBU2729811.1 RusA family crossover junction endodeoxyribonuclease [Acidithiobacillus caldus]MBU2736395.1 RusA family crossover junction endodeoxyribonuclease [Acidithiobacillus caldus ATCC 51756]MBU2743972.1 RusA family crossover junction endodeoxyribonuclease [Acidithiobacillus caldus]MBU2763718.1 RusA family crossover junc
MPSITLPYPPSTNRIWRTAGGKTYLPAKVADYKRRAAWVAKMAMRDRPPLTGPVAVRIVLHPVLPKDAEKRRQIWGDYWHLELRCIDLANAEKAAVDALQGVAFEDDKQIVRMVLERGQPVPEGAVFVEWTPFDGGIT